MNDERSGRPLIGAILEDKFGLPEAKLLEAINLQGTKGGRLGEILIRPANRFTDRRPRGMRCGRY